MGGGVLTLLPFYANKAMLHKEQATKPAWLTSPDKDYAVGQWGRAARLAQAHKTKPRPLPEGIRGEGPGCLPSPLLPAPNPGRALTAGAIPLPRRLSLAGGGGGEKQSQPGSGGRGGGAGKWHLSFENQTVRPGSGSVPARDTRSDHFPLHHPHLPKGRGGRSIIGITFQNTELALSNPDTVPQNPRSHTHIDRPPPPPPTHTHPTHAFVQELLQVFQIKSTSELKGRTEGGRAKKKGGKA